MTVNVFGHPLTKNEVSSSYVRGPSEVGFQLTEDGQFDIQNKRLCNVAVAVAENDVVTLYTLKKSFMSKRAFTTKFLI